MATTLTQTGAEVQTAIENAAYKINVLDYGADLTGSSDSTTAFTNAFAAIRTSISDNKTTKALIIPPGTYKISGSVNATNIFAWNVYVDGMGAVLNCDGANKNSIDMTGSRGFHIYGLTFDGDATNTPDCGLFVGPIGTATCGNNAFYDCKWVGDWDVAAFWNHGSETSKYYNCYFFNEKTGERYAYLGDGYNQFGAASDFQTVRAADTAVSYTQNAFYGCIFRNDGDDAGLYLAGTSGWYFDRGCYHLAFDKCNVRLFQNTAVRNSNLHLNGLFETDQTPGVDHVLEIICDNGEISAMENCELIFNSPLADVSLISVIDSAAGTAGTLKFSCCTLRVHTSSVDLLDSGNNGVIEFTGQIFFRDFADMNLEGFSVVDAVVHTSETTRVIQYGSGVYQTATASTTLTINDAGKVYTNETATGNIAFTLPSAKKGLFFPFVVQNTNTLTINANTGDVIRINGSSSSSAGSAAANVRDDMLALLAINNTDWVAVGVTGTWTLT